MERTKTRSRAKAAPLASSDINGPDSDHRIESAEKTPQPEIKKTRKGKKKKPQEGEPEINIEPAPEEATKKRAKRVKAKDIVEEIEKLSVDEPEEATEPVSPPKKPKKSTRKAGRKKREEAGEDEQEPAKEETQEVVEENKENPTVDKKTSKKRGRKPVAAEHVEEAPELVPATIQVQTSVDEVKAAEETCSNRTRSRTKTANKELAEKPDLNKTREINKLIEPAVKSQEPVVVEAPAESTAPSEPPASVKKPKTGGARIVRPKETITVVSSDNVVEQVEKKVVEIVRREAGPRIVKPPEAIIQEQQLAAKRKQNTEEKEQNKVVKKLKDKTEIAPKKDKIPTQNLAATEPKTDKKDAPPDFKTIHQKEASKLESIIDFQKRLHQRHRILSNQGEPPVARSVSAVRSGATAVNLGRSPSLRESNIPRSSGLPKPNFATAKENQIAVVKIRRLDPNNQSTPNQTTVLGAQSSNIPVLVQKPAKETKPEKTPRAHISRAKAVGLEKNENSLAPKTPRNRPASQMAPKTPANQPKNASNGENVQKSAQKNSAAAVIPPQLATSSFIRRKSFDLNASLSRRLAYKPYIGKLKPIESKACPPSASNNVLSTTRVNLNTTKN